MSIKYKYRFKTEKEFIEEFGYDWRSKVFFNSEGFMDYLCGKVLELNISEKDFTSDGDNIFWLENEYESWYISLNMVTLIEQVPDYTPRKIIREI